MENRPVDGPQVKAKSEVYREWLALDLEDCDRQRREENEQDRADILRLEALSTLELKEQAQAIWEDYRAKHQALRAGDDDQIKAMEKDSPNYLWGQLADDAMELARVLAIIWERGETWSPSEPVLVPTR
jgi:hypothetical protein